MHGSRQQNNVWREVLSVHLSWTDTRRLLAAHPDTVHKDTRSMSSGGKGHIKELVNAPLSKPQCYNTTPYSLFTSFVFG